MFVCLFVRAAEKRQMSSDSGARRWDRSRNITPASWTCSQVGDTGCVIFSSSSLSSQCSRGCCSWGKRSWDAAAAAESCQQQQQPAALPRQLVARRENMGQTWSSNRVPQNTQWAKNRGDCISFAFVLIVLVLMLLLASWRCTDCLLNFVAHVTPWCDNEISSILGGIRLEAPGDIVVSPGRFYFGVKYWLYFCFNILKNTHSDKVVLKERRRRCGYKSTRNRQHLCISSTTWLLIIVYCVRQPRCHLYLQKNKKNKKNTDVKNTTQGLREWAADVHATCQ